MDILSAENPINTQTEKAEFSQAGAALPTKYTIKLEQRAVYPKVEGYAEISKALGLDKDGKVSNLFLTKKVDKDPDASFEKKHIAYFNFDFSNGRLKEIRMPVGDQAIDVIYQQKPELIAPGLKVPYMTVTDWFGDAPTTKTFEIENGKISSGKSADGKPVADLNAAQTLFSQTLQTGTDVLKALQNNPEVQANKELMAATDKAKIDLLAKPHQADKSADISNAAAAALPTATPAAHAHVKSGKGGPE